MNIGKNSSPNDGKLRFEIEPIKFLSPNVAAYPKFNEPDPAVLISLNAIGTDKKDKNR